MENGATVNTRSQNVNIESMAKQKPQISAEPEKSAEPTKEHPRDLVDLDSSVQDMPISTSAPDMPASTSAPDMPISTSAPDMPVSTSLPESLAPPEPFSVLTKEKQNEKEVTVLLYMDGQYPDLESTMASIPIGLEAVGSSDAMNIVMQLGRAPQGQVYPDGGFDRVDNDWSGVRRYFITKQEAPHKGTVTLGDWLDVSRENPDNPLIHYVLGEVYESQGMKPEAEKEFARAEQLGYMKFFLEPFDPQVKEWSQDFQKALQPLRDKDAAVNLYESPVIQNMGTGVDMKHPQNLKDFVAWGMKNYPAKHFVVVMGGHGGAWTGALQMSPSDIGMAIQAGTHQANRSTGRADGVDALVFNSCYMGNLESLNEMKDAADVILASEMSAKSSVLKDWPEILDHVQKDLDEGKSFDSKEFARDVVGYYQEKGDEIKDLPLMKKFSREHYLTLTAIDTAKLVDITNAWKEFVSNWDQSGIPDSEIFKVIDSSKNYPSFAYTPEMLFDFGTLRDLGDIAQRITDTEKLPQKVRDDAANIKKALQEAVIAEQHTGHDMDKSTGLTIWAPTNVSDVALMAAPYGKRVPDFVQQTNWDKKLAAAVDKVDPQQLGKFMKCIRLLAQIQQSLKGEQLSEKEIKDLESRQKLLKSEVIKLRESLSIVRPLEIPEEKKLELTPMAVEQPEEDKQNAKAEEYIEKTVKSSSKQDGMSHGRGLYVKDMTDLDREMVDSFTDDILNDSQLFNGMKYMPNS